MTGVSACLVTRGDVDLQPVIDSLACFDEIVIWDNGAKMVTRSDGWAEVCTDLAVYGRYAAIEHASHDLIFVVDDDVIVSDPTAIANEWIANCQWEVTNMKPPGDGRLYESVRRDGQHVVCNIPQEFRSNYPDSGLVGFGAAFHRDAPARAFGRFWNHQGWKSHLLAGLNDIAEIQRAEFLRRADNVFTTLTPRVLVDIEKQDREFASDPTRMWKQPGHEQEKQRMIALARQVRDV